MTVHPNGAVRGAVVQESAVLAPPRRPGIGSDSSRVTASVDGISTSHAGESARVASPARRLRLTRALQGRAWMVAMMVTDCAMLCAAAITALRWPPEPVPLSEGGALLLLPPMTMTILAFRGAYEQRLRVGLLDGAGTILGAVSLAVMVIVVGETYIGHPPIAAGVLVHLWALSIVLLLVGRCGAGLFQRWARGSAVLARPTLIIGAGVVGAKLARRLIDDAQYGLRPVGFLDDDPTPLATIATGLPVLGSPDQLETVARGTDARHVVVAFSACADRSFVPMVRRARAAGIDISLVPRMFETMNDRVAFESIGGVRVLGLRATDPVGWRFTVKHTGDRVLAAVLLILLAPLMLAVTAAIWLTSPGPVLFTQVRVGRDGQPFKLLKFRTMRPATGQDAGFVPPNGCGPGGVEGADRRTRIGRCMRRRSLDELPQLINVLKGEMSLVGPRPERVQFAEAFTRDIERYGDRSRVKAGITGWAQVHGLRGQTSIADRTEWDNFYIENWSLKLDLRILAMTLLAVLRPGEE
jgi:exopolysaccharide biosynthesis polyprenyl glycosylphosphotransferase